MNWKVPLSVPDLGEEELASVHAVIKDQWLTMGAVTERFEWAFGHYLGVRHAVAVANGTAALHLGLLSLGLGPGDEVIVPSLSFVATANAVRYTGACACFADITSEWDLGISADSVREAITARTRAVVVMHYAGYPCDMPSILALAREYGLFVVEDAAHAPGASLEGQKMGTWGDVGCFSFFSNKNLVTGEGGMVVTNDDDIAARIRLLRSHGMTTTTWDRHRGHASSYDVVALGYNYRLDEIRSALGIAQLHKLDESNARRRSICDRYGSLLGEVDEVRVPYPEHPGVTAAHIRPVLLAPDVNREAFMSHLRRRGIQTSIHYPPIHQFSSYAARTNRGDLHLTEQVAAREVTLPLYPSMGERQLRQVVNGVKGALVRQRFPRMARAL